MTASTSLADPALTAALGRVPARLGWRVKLQPSSFLLARRDLATPG
jgi:hypothetical protein